MSTYWDGVMSHLFKMLFIMIGIMCTCYTLYSFVFAGKEESQFELMVDKKLGKSIENWFAPSNVPDVPRNPYRKKAK
jgi:predicted membrane protein